MITDFDPLIDEDLMNDGKDTQNPFTMDLYQPQPTNLLMPVKGSVQISPYHLKQLKQVKKCQTIGSHYSNIQQQEELKQKNLPLKGGILELENIKKHACNAADFLRKPLGSLPSQQARRSLAPPSTQAISQALNLVDDKNNDCQIAVTSERRGTLLKSEMFYNATDTQTAVGQTVANKTGASTQRDTTHAQKSFMFMINRRDSKQDSQQQPVSSTNNSLNFSGALQKQPLQHIPNSCKPNHKNQTNDPNQNSCHQLLQPMQHISPLKIGKQAEIKDINSASLHLQKCQKNEKQFQQLQHSTNFGCLNQNKGGLNDLSERSSYFESDDEINSHSSKEDQKANHLCLENDNNSVNSDSLPLMKSPKVQQQKTIPNAKNNNLRNKNESRSIFKSNIHKQQKGKKSNMFISSLDVLPSVQKIAQDQQQGVLPQTNGISNEHFNTNLNSTDEYKMSVANQQDDILKETCGPQVFNNSGVLLSANSNIGNTKNKNNISINHNNNHLMHIKPRNKELLQSLQQPVQQKQNTNNQVILGLPQVNQPQVSQRHVFVNNSLNCAQQLQELLRTSKEKDLTEQQPKFDPPKEFENLQGSQCGQFFFKSKQKQSFQLSKESHKQIQNNHQRQSSLIPIIVTHGEWQGSKDSLIQPWADQNLKNSNLKQHQLSSEQSQCIKKSTEDSYGINLKIQGEINTPNHTNQHSRKLSIAQKQQTRAILNDTMSNGFKEAVVQNQAQNNLSQQSTNGTNQSKADSKNTSNADSSGSSRRSRSSLCYSGEEAATDANSFNTQQQLEIQQTKPSKFSSPTKHKSNLEVSDYIPIQVKDNSNGQQSIEQEQDHSCIGNKLSIENNKTKRNLRLQTFRMQQPNATNNQATVINQSKEICSAELKNTHPKQNENCYSEVTTDKIKTQKRLSSFDKQQFALPNINSKRSKQQQLGLMAASDLRL